MLKVTPDAASALSSVRAEAGAPDTYGVRFFSTRGPDESPQLAFDFVAEPQSEDVIGEESGLRTFTAPDVEQLVGEATVDLDQSGSQANLVVRPS